MHVIDGYRRAPGCCVKCKSPSVGVGGIDLGVEDPGIIVRMAQVYLCGDCAMQVGTMIAPLHGKAIVDATVAEQLAEAQHLLAAAHRELAKNAEIFAAIRGSVPEPTGDIL